MKFKIGFCADSFDDKKDETAIEKVHAPGLPRKSLVQVYFSGRNMNLAYYNDQFDLHVGDIVYVDGKLEGLRGRVTEVNYTFKIKLADYKRVIAVADTNVTGEFHLAGSHMVTFDRAAVPYEKVITWFKAPNKEDDEFVSGDGDNSFLLENLGTMKISSDIADRGNDYYMQNKVSYISIDGTHGRAIVEGSTPYELEFEYHAGEIRNLTCSCFCSYPCKHEFAAMLQLRETLDFIKENYSEHLNSTNYFAALSKKVFFSIAVDSKKTGSICLK